jgi:hypothetical protein
MSASDKGGLAAGRADTVPPASSSCPLVLVKLVAAAAATAAGSDDDALPFNTLCALPGASGLDRASLLTALLHNDLFATRLAGVALDACTVEACASASDEEPSAAEAAAAVPLKGAKTLGRVAANAPPGANLFVVVRLPSAAQLARAQQPAPAAEHASVDFVSALFARLGAPSPSPSTTAALAASVLEVLGGPSPRVTDLAPVAGGTCALTTDEVARLELVAAAQYEAGVVAAMTAHLRRLCLPSAATTSPRDPFRLVLVNSERVPWLFQPSSPARIDLRQKPDLFLSWAPFVEYRDGDETLGGLGGYRLQQLGCVAALFEAKRGGLTESHFGELCGYHACIPHGACRGMLFGPAAFQLYMTVNAHPYSLIRGRWDTPGAEEAIRSFFAGVQEPSLLLLLRALARLLRVQPAHVDGRCYLGSGAAGHVFTVGDPRRPHALKVVPTSDPAAVATEFALLTEAAKRGAPVVRPAPGSLHTDVTAAEGVTGSGYLLESVGRPFAIDTLARCTSAFESLAACHRASVVHGDARLPNLLALGPAGAPAWIDLRTCPVLGEPFQQLAARDARTLARSVLRLEGATAVLPRDVDSALARYSAGDDSSVAALAAAVWASGTKARR